MTENEVIKITGNNVTEKEINLETLYQLVEKFNKGHWGDIQLFEDEENRYSTVIEKVIEEIQQYRAIGTVEEFKNLKEKETEILLKDGQFLYQQGLVDGYAKAIDEFAEKMRTKIMCEIDDCADELDWIDEIAEQLKDGAKHDN